MIAFSILTMALIFVAIGQLNFKLYAVRSSGPNLVVAIIFFAGAQIGFFFALMDLHIGVVYMSTALTQGLVLLLAHYVLQEALTRHHLIALVMIIVGLVLYAG